MFFLQRKLKKILKESNHERALKEFARKLGCSTLGLADQHLEIRDEQKLISRIHEAARSRRESWLWLIAVIAAVASVISALAAWFAVILREGGGNGAS